VTSSLLSHRPDDVLQTSPRDTHPGAGPGFVLRRALIYGFGMVGANTLGALVTFLYATIVIPPLPGHGDDNEQTRLSLLVFLIYLVVAMLVGVLWSVIRFRPTLSWLLADRFPDEPERQATLRQPGRQLLVHATLWAAGVVVFLVVNARYSWTLARDAALSAALGGLFTCAVGYLLGERLLRPVTIMALGDREPKPPAGPGVMARVVWAWAMGTGVPVLGAALALWIRGRPDDLARNLPALFLVVFSLLTGLVAMLLLARSIAVPIASVRHVVRAVAGGDTTAELRVVDAGEIGQLQAAVNEMTAGLHESERIQDIFGRQVGTEVAREVLSQGIALGGEIRRVAVLFVDLDGSTAFASRHEPTEVVDLLNTFFGAVVDVITKHGGVINKFHGDGALCVFGAPVEHPLASTAALAAARELRDRVLDLDHHQISAGIGVSVGPVVAGNVGAESRFEYTVIGDPVNEASRLTDLAKQRSERLLAAASVLHEAERSEAERWQTRESVTLSGRSEPTRLAVPS
jgi:adenylate cyclase